MTTLAETQRAFTRICFDEEPRPEDLALLHSPDAGWLLYRGMVRGRLFGMMRTGLPRTAELLGDERFDAAMSSYLAESGPHTRFIRNVVHELVDHALAGWQQNADLPKYLSDLVRYEAAKWKVASLEWDAAPQLTEELDFEGIPVWNPTIQTVQVEHRVDKECVELEEPHLLIVYRKAESPRIFTYVLNAVASELFEAWQIPDRSCADGVRAMLASSERGPDARFIDGMAGVLAGLVEETVVLGSRA